MKSIKEVIDKMITSIPNKIYKHYAGGFQLIKLIEMKIVWAPLGLWPPQAGHATDLSPHSDYPFKKGPYQVTSMSFR